MIDTSVLLLLVAVLIIGIFVFIAIWFTGRRTHQFDKEDYQTDFIALENQLIKDQPLTYNATVIEADKLLDKALMELGIPGKTMGERLKRSKDRFTELNSVWYVHKLRNQIAHERGFQVEYNQARHALITYRKALKDLGAI